MDRHQMDAGARIQVILGRTGFDCAIYSYQYQSKCLQILIR